MSKNPLSEHLKNVESEPFKLVSEFEPAGDQPQAIRELVEGIKSNKKFQTLLGVTGSGKTFTMANVIAQINRPTLVMAPNKTLAAQLYSEFKSFFPHNAVEYFVSYYDYYQPEAYLPSTDTYIEKDSAINEEIDKLRHSATRSLLERRDVLIVASVSCIYGLGSPEAYLNMMLMMHKGEKIRRDDFLRRLVEIGYQRSDADFHRGSFRVRGDFVDIFPAYESLRALRAEFFGAEIVNLHNLDPIQGIKLEPLKMAAIYPASHYVSEAEQKKKAISSVLEELRVRLGELKELHKTAEAQRLEQRTLLDVEMLQEVGYCSGVENYSRHLSGRAAGEAPPTLFEYFYGDWLLIMDESHISVSQVGGMYRGDRARKINLVEHGFRLPSALDNRPLKFEEFESLMKQVVFVSATPAAYELEHSGGHFVEQVIRPTGLLDPTLEVRPAREQIADLIIHVRKRITKGERTLVTTLTKKMAEDLSEHFQKIGIKVRYMHSDIETLERIEILRDLRAGRFDVLVGINLLREGLDLPEVSLVAILDADKEGFLRSRTSLIQTFGRAARNANGHVIMYADRITRSMEEAMGETQRRRTKQEAYNLEHGIVPQTIIKSKQNLVTDRLSGEANRRLAMSNLDYVDFDEELRDVDGKEIKPHEIPEIAARLEGEMRAAAKQLNFERAAQLRDRLLKLREEELKWKESKAPSSKTES